MGDNYDYDDDGDDPPSREKGERMEKQGAGFPCWWTVSLGDLRYL